MPESHVLVRGSRYSEEAKSGLYQQGQHRWRINQAYQNYFAALGRALYREMKRGNSLMPKIASPELFQ